MMGKFFRVRSVHEIPAGTGKMVQVEGKTIALFILSGNFYATDDTCPHEGGPLSSGSIEGDNVSCPCHGATFHIKSGRTLEPPVGEKMGPPVDKGVSCLWPAGCGIGC